MTDFLKDTPLVQGLRDAPSPTSERQFRVTTVVMAHDMFDAIRKSKNAEPISVELMDFLEERKVVGFRNTHD